MHTRVMNNVSSCQVEVSSSKFKSTRTKSTRSISSNAKASDADIFRHIYSKIVKDQSHVGPKSDLSYVSLAEWNIYWNIYFDTMDARLALSRVISKLKAKQRIAKNKSQSNITSNEIVSSPTFQYLVVPSSSTTSLKSSLKAIIPTKSVRFGEMARFLPFYHNLAPELVSFLEEEFKATKNDALSRRKRAKVVGVRDLSKEVAVRAERLAIKIQGPRPLNDLSVISPSKLLFVLKSSLLVLVPIFSSQRVNSLISICASPTTSLFASISFSSLSCSVPCVSSIINNKPIFIRAHHITISKAKHIITSSTPNPTIRFKIISSITARHRQLAYAVVGFAGKFHLVKIVVSRQAIEAITRRSMISYTAPLLIAAAPSSPHAVRGVLFSLDYVSYLRSTPSVSSRSIAAPILPQLSGTSVAALHDGHLLLTTSIQSTDISSLRINKTSIPARNVASPKPKNAISQFRPIHPIYFKVVSSITVGPLQLAWAVIGFAGKWHLVKIIISKQAIEVSTHRAMISYSAPLLLTAAPSSPHAVRGALLSLTHVSCLRSSQRLSPCFVPAPLPQLSGSSVTSLYGSHRHLTPSLQFINFSSLMPSPTVSSTPTEIEDVQPSTSSPDSSPTTISSPAEIDSAKPPTSSPDTPAPQVIDPSTLVPAQPTASALTEIEAATCTDSPALPSELANEAVQKNITEENVQTCLSINSATFTKRLLTIDTMTFQNSPQEELPTLIADEQSEQESSSPDTPENPWHEEKSYSSLFGPELDVIGQDTSIVVLDRSLPISEHKPATGNSVEDYPKTESPKLEQSFCVPEEKQREHDSSFDSLFDTRPQDEDMEQVDADAEEMDDPDFTAFIAELESELLVHDEELACDASKFNQADPDVIYKSLQFFDSTSENEEDIEQVDVLGSDTDADAHAEGVDDAEYTEFITELESELQIHIEELARDDAQQTEGDASSDADTDGVVDSENERFILELESELRIHAEEDLDAAEQCDPDATFDPMFDSKLYDEVMDDNFVGSYADAEGVDDAEFVEYIPHDNHEERMEEEESSTLLTRDSSGLCSLTPTAMMDWVSSAPPPFDLATSAATEFQQNPHTGGPSVSCLRHSVSEVHVHPDQEMRADDKRTLNKNDDDDDIISLFEEDVDMGAVAETPTSHIPSAITWFSSETLSGGVAAILPLPSSSPPDDVELDTDALFAPPPLATLAPVSRFPMIYRRSVNVPKHAIDSGLAQFPKHSETVTQIPPITPTMIERTIALQVSSASIQQSVSTSGPARKIDRAKEGLPFTFSLTAPICPLNLATPDASTLNPSVITPASATSQPSVGPVVSTDQTVVSVVPTSTSTEPDPASHSYSSPPTPSASYVVSQDWDAEACTAWDKLLEAVVYPGVSTDPANQMGEFDLAAMDRDLRQFENCLATRKDATNVADTAPVDTSSADVDDFFNDAVKATEPNTIATQDDTKGDSMTSRMMRRRKDADKPALFDEDAMERHELEDLVPVIPDDLVALLRAYADDEKDDDDDPAPFDEEAFRRHQHEASLPDGLLLLLQAAPVYDSDDAYSSNLRSETADQRCSKSFPSTDVLPTVPSATPTAGPKGEEVVVRNGITIRTDDEGEWHYGGDEVLCY